MIVVVGFDGSAASTRAARYSVTFAARQRARLLVVEIFDPDSSLGWAPLAVTGDADVLDALHEATRQDFVDLLGDTAVDWRLHQVIGSSLRELTAVATAAQADVVIIGASRPRRLRPARSVMAQLVSNGLFPVIVVP